MPIKVYSAVAALLAVVFAVALAGVSPALAALGVPVPGELGLQDPGSTEMEHLSTLYHYVNITIIVIALFVLLLMIWVIFRYRESANPTPSRTTHNTFLEVAWTIVPILILVALAIPSFRLLFEQYSFPKPDITLKATGNAWFWDYEYVDDKVSLSSTMINDEDVIKEKIGDEAFDKKYGSLEGAALHNALYQDSLPIWAERKQIRRLTVDQDIAVPVGKVVHVLVTSNDVIHQWVVPGFGVKIQAVPGRTSALWFKATKVGSYHGQCSVLCGKLHSAMPITVRVLDQNVYDSWMGALKAKDKKKAAEILKADAASTDAVQNLTALIGGQ